MQPILNKTENTEEYTVVTVLGEITYHREDGPAYIYFWPNGNKKLEIWYLNGLRTKLDGPAVIEYYDNGNKKEEQWYVSEEQHRIDGPAWIIYNETGAVVTEYYFQNNLLFRENDLPTIVNY
jgi:antitoxin component YwqK of YwqJK toxin-antitoxin module